MHKMESLSGQVADGQIDGARDYQEDAFRCREVNRGDAQVLLLVLADGMGGHVGGAYAAKLAVENFIEHFVFDEDTNADDAPGPCLRRALDAANAAIGKDAQDPRYTNMGCTLLACWIANDVLRWISVGDSPLWLLRDNKIKRLNEDHSMRPILEGTMSEEELDQDPRVNQLRSAVMGGEISRIDQKSEPFALTNGDRVILASDGMETLKTDKIATLCHNADSAHAVSELLNAVKDRHLPGQDNATVAVYQHEVATA